MGLLDNYTGIGMCPRPKWAHQIIMNNLHINVANELSKKFWVLTEATLTDDWDDKAPDLVVFDKIDMYPLMMVEITTHRELLKIKRKCDNLAVRFPEIECWAFDYEEEKLYHFDIPNRHWELVDDNFRSDFLQLPMIEYFYEHD